MDDVLLEREAEAQALREVIAAAIGGRGGAVLIEGEAGIGKTRLLALARDEATSAGANVLYATADETEASVPLAGARVLLGRAARGLVPDGPARLGVLALEGALGDPSGAGSRADEVVHALWWLVVELADQRPLALIVDDAQWADELTLRLLRMIARRAGEAPLALIVGARPAAPGRPHGMLGAERAFTRLEPAPLSIAGAARLLAPEPDDVVAQARAMTGGNPLYLRELAHHLRAGGAGGRSPPQLVRLIADRLARLTPEAAALAEAVAVLGADADPTRARALAGLDALACIAAEEELRAERVFDARGYGFLHPLVAAAARDGIGAIRASELHAQAAALLARDGVDDRASRSIWRRAAAAATPPSWRRCAARPKRRGGWAPWRPPCGCWNGRWPSHRQRSSSTRWPSSGRGPCSTAAPTRARPRSRASREARRDLAVRVDAGRQLANCYALEGRGEDAVEVLRDVLETLDEAHETRLELLAEAALVAGSIRGGRAEAQRTIAARGGTGDAGAQRPSGCCWSPPPWSPARRRRIRRRRPGRCSRSACTATSRAATRSRSSPSRRRCC